MRKAFEVNEKLMIITIILGFIFGIYLAIGHDDPNLWFVVVQWIFLDFPKKFYPMYKFFH